MIGHMEVEGYNSMFATPISHKVTPVIPIVSELVQWGFRG